MRNIALLLVLGFAFWVSGCSNNAQQPVNSTAPLVVQSAKTAAQQMNSGPSAVAQNTPDTTSESTNTTEDSPDLTSGNPLCTITGDIEYAKLGRSGSDARKRVAEALTEVADKKFGPGVIFASAAGLGNGVLLLAATPQNERSLRFFGIKNVQTIRDRAELCAEDGFRQVQLIVRQDDGVNQRLVKKVVLDFDEAERYMSQTTGARPVQ